MKNKVSICASITDRIEVTVDGEVDVDVDEVLGELSDDDLAAAIARRGSNCRLSGGKLTLIYEEFARRGDAPQVLKDFIYEAIGRIL